MNWYNGFSSNERNAVGRVISKAYHAGVFRALPVCGLCGLHGIIKSRDVAPHLMCHYEDYGRPAEPTVICVECHMRLHARFSQPNRWRQHCLDIRDTPATSWASVQDYFGMSRKLERHDISPVDLMCDPTRWWERLSFDMALKSAPELGVGIAMTYGHTNDVCSLVVTVTRDVEQLKQLQLL